MESKSEQKPFHPSCCSEGEGERVGGKGERERERERERDRKQHKIFAYILAGAVNREEREIQYTPTNGSHST